jgi:hypothetical protein
MTQSSASPLLLRSVDYYSHFLNHWKKHTHADACALLLSDAPPRSASLLHHLRLVGLLFFPESVMLLLEPPSIVDDPHSVGVAGAIACVSLSVVPVPPSIALPIGLLAFLFPEPVIVPLEPPSIVADHSSAAAATVLVAQLEAVGLQIVLFQFEFVLQTVLVGVDVLFQFEFAVPDAAASVGVGSENQHGG